MVPTIIKYINLGKVRMSSNSSGRSALPNHLLSHDPMTQPHPKNIENKLQPSIKGSGRENQKQSWTLKGSNISSDHPKLNNGSSNADFSYPQSNEPPRRPDSKRLNSLGRPPSDHKISQSNLYTSNNDKAKPQSVDFTVIHVIDENKKKQKDFK